MSNWFKRNKKNILETLFDILIFGSQMVMLVLGLLLCVWIHDITNSSWLTRASFLVFPTLFMMLPVLVSVYKDEIKAWFKRLRGGEKYVVPKEEDTREYFDGAPHFGSLFGYSQIEEFLENENFIPYVDSKGKKSRHIKVSESDKWGYFLGGFMPLDLLCGYNEYRNEIYTIDGAVIRLPKKAWRPSARRDMRDFFSSRGQYYTVMPNLGERTFEAALGEEKSLSKADWSKLRYKWEKEIMKKSKRVLVKTKFKPIAPEGGATPDFFERVLTNNELKMVATSVRREDIDLSEYLDFAKFKNEFSVCNGIELVKMLKGTKREEGLDFLFECLNDIDEAYFMEAAALLKTYPKEILKTRMEETAKRSYESADALKLAGVLYLSKELGYDIEYIEQKKEQIQKAQEEKQRVEEAIRNGQIPGFQVESGSAVAYAEVPGFEFEGQ